MSSININIGNPQGPAGPAGAAVPIAANTILANATNATATPTGINAATARTLLSINNVDNTSDTDKPISTATQAALNDKSSSIHAHGNITNDGKIGSTANLPLITTASGAITVGAFGTSANTFCEGNDSRLLSPYVVLAGVDAVNRISLDASNGVIDWGLALTGNSRGSLTWETDKAIVESPIRLDLEAPTIALVGVTAVCSGELIWLPNSSTTLSVNGQICIDRLSNTQVRLKMRGDDETNRLAILTLS